MKKADTIMTINPRTKTRAKNSKSGINSVRTREWRIIQHAEIWGGRAPTVVVYRRELPLRWNWNATTASVGVPAYACL